MFIDLAKSHHTPVDSRHTSAAASPIAAAAKPALDYQRPAVGPPKCLQRFKRENVTVDLFPGRPLTMPKTRSNLVFFLAATALLLAGCSAADAQGNDDALPNDGPLALDHHGSACLPYPRFDHVALGTRMDVSGRKPVRILSVTPRRTLNADIESESVMASEPSNRLFAYSWPLDKTYGRPWKEAIPAIGASLPAGSSTDLVTEVQPVIAGKTVHIPTVRIIYRVEGGGTFRADSDYQLVMSTLHCSDSDSLTD